MSKSIYQKVGIASLVMMSSIFLSRLLGILREIVIAYLSGTSGSVDAYQISFVVPEILNHVLATGFLSISFIPIFTRYLSQNSEEKAWQVFSNVLNCFGLLSFILIALLFVWAEELIGLTGLKQTESFVTAVQMTQIIIPAQFFFFVGGLLMAVQFAKEQFLIPALAPLIYNLGIILGGIVLYPFLGMESFSWGVLLGAFLGNFAVQWLGARRVGLRYSFLFKWRDQDLKKYLVTTLPMMLGLTMTFSTEIFPKLFGSFLSQGSVSALNYGLRIMFLLVGLFGQAVGVASYPYLSRLAVENRIGELNQLLNTTLKQIALVIPFSILIIILRYEIVVLLFQRGQFDSASSRLTSEVLTFLMIGAFAFAAQTIVTRGYYALQNTLFPTLFISAAVILTLPLYYLGMRTMGINGVGLALTLSTILQVTLLYALWSRSSDNRGSQAVYLLYLKTILVSLLLGGMLWSFKHFVLSGIDPQTFFGSLLSIILVSLVFLVASIAIAYLFKIKEVFDILSKISTKIGLNR